MTIAPRHGRTDNEDDDDDDGGGRGADHAALSANRRILMQQSFDAIRTRSVMDAAGVVIGEVDALFFDDQSWKTEMLRVRVRRDLVEQAGMERSLFRRATIDVPTRLVQSIGDAILLSVTLDKLAAESSAQPAAPASP